MDQENVYRCVLVWDCGDQGLFSIWTCDFCAKEQFPFPLLSAKLNWRFFLQISYTGRTGPFYLWRPNILAHRSISAWLSNARWSQKKSAKSKLLGFRSFWLSRCMVPAFQLFYLSGSFQLSSPAFSKVTALKKKFKRRRGAYIAIQCMPPARRAYLLRNRLFILMLQAETESVFSCKNGIFFQMAIKPSSLRPKTTS